MFDRMVLALASVSVSAAIGAGSLQAQEVEATIRQRSVVVSEDALQEILWAAEEEDAEYASEDAYNRAMADYLFNLSQAELDGLVSSGRAELSESLVHVRGLMIRVDEAPGGAYSVLDLGSGTMWIVNPAERTYLELTKAYFEEVQSRVEAMWAEAGLDPEAMADADAEDAGGGSASVVPLGQGRTLNGFQVQGFRAASGEEYGEAWCARDELGLAVAFEKLAGQMDAMDEDGQGTALEDVMCSEGIAVLTKTFSPYGTIFEVSEVLAMEAEPQARELFEIPDAYRRLDPSEIWR